MPSGNGARAKQRRERQQSKNAGKDRINPREAAKVEEKVLCLVCRQVRFARSERERERESERGRPRIRRRSARRPSHPRARPQPFPKSTTKEPEFRRHWESKHEKTHKISNCFPFLAAAPAAPAAPAAAAAAAVAAPR
jgi:hypothetical protein